MKLRLMIGLLIIGVACMLASCGSNTAAGQESREPSPGAHTQERPEDISLQDISLQDISPELADIYKAAGIYTSHYGGVVPRNGFWMPYYYGCLIYFDRKDVQVTDPDGIYLKAIQPDGTPTGEIIKANAHMDGIVLFITPAEYREGAYVLIFEPGALSHVNDAFYACSGKIRLEYRAPVEGNPEDVEVLPLHEGDRMVRIAYNGERLDYDTQDHMTDIRMHLEPEDTKWFRWDSYFGMSSSLDNGYKIHETSFGTGADGRRILELPLPEGLGLEKGETYVMELMTGAFVEKDTQKPVKHGLFHLVVQ